jgi:flagellar basal-body rod protein FlgB
MRETLQAEGFRGKTTREGHIPIGGTAEALNVQPAVVQDSGSAMRMDQNNVDIDHEMSELAKNQIYYETLVRQLSSELGRLKMAIEGK